MDIKEAVKTAKNYVAEVFSSEGVRNLALEEIEFDDNQNAWSVTISFFRTREEELDPEESCRRFYAPHRKDLKVVRISDKSGTPLSIRNRDIS